MGNVFCTELRIHREFDLKGSSLGHSSDTIEIDENTTPKDLDLNHCFYLGPSLAGVFIKMEQKQWAASTFKEGHCSLQWCGWNIFSKS
ncbi:unnamed protein product [Trifolium pratense]|uniref:Uncharacterized protein n=1 Tax=Trifolium pratense TaxID=57577 RepID=A0ACB0K3U4_TRIPR|nr:unnamed protein product [Trifolium pratense]